LEQSEKTWKQAFSLRQEDERERRADVATCELEKRTGNAIKMQINKRGENDDIYSYHQKSIKIMF
jgi:hypothetical protein